MVDKRDLNPFVLAVLQRGREIRCEVASLCTKRKAELSRIFDNYVDFNPSNRHFIDIDEVAKLEPRQFINSFGTLSRICEQDSANGNHLDALCTMLATCSALSIMDSYVTIPKEVHKTYRTALHLKLAKYTE